MTNLDIHLIVAVDGITLAVVSIPDGYQFSVIDNQGYVHQPQLLFEEAEAAERQGRKWIYANLPSC